MRIYLRNKKTRFESSKGAQIGCLASTIVFLLFVLYLIVSDNSYDDFHELSPLLIIIIILVFIIILIKKRRISIKSNGIETLKIIIAFLKESGIKNKEIISIVRGVFSIYSNKNIDKHIHNAIFTKIDIKKACQNLSGEPSDIKYFLLYSLLDIAANDTILTIDEENFITKIRKGIHIHEITYNNIKNNYLKQGLKDERKIIEEQNRKKRAESFSKSFIPYNAYKILGVSPSVSKAQLKKVFRKLAKKYHPDKFHGQSEEIIQKTEDKFQEILDAYEIIKKYKGYYK